MAKERDALCGSRNTPEQPGEPVPAVRTPGRPSTDRSTTVMNLAAVDQAHHTEHLGEPSRHPIECKQPEPRGACRILRLLTLNNEKCDICVELRTHGGTVALPCSLAPRVENLSFRFSPLTASTLASVKPLYSREGDLTHNSLKFSEKEELRQNRTRGDTTLRVRLQRGTRKEPKPRERSL